MLLRTPGLTGCIVGARSARQGALIASLGVVVSDEQVAAVERITAALTGDLAELESGRRGVGRARVVSLSAPRSSCGARAFKPLLATRTSIRAPCRRARRREAEQILAVELVGDAREGRRQILAGPNLE